jgi:hypothetical protein
VNKLDDYQILGLFLFLAAVIIVLFIILTKTDDRSHRAVRSARKAVQALREHLITDHGMILEPPEEEQPTDIEELEETKEADREDEALQESDEALLGEVEDTDEDTEDDYSDAVDELEEIETEDLDSEELEDELLEDNDLQRLEDPDSLEE